MTDEVPVGSILASHATRHPRFDAARLTVSIVLRVVYVIAALAIFILALQLLKAGAAGLEPILDHFNVQGTANSVGFGWLGSYVVLSGSPVAAIALTLFSQDVLSQTETFAMINGSRMGASFIVLFVGFLYWIRGKRNPAVYTKTGLYIGVVALLVAFTLWAPVIPIGQFILDEGWFEDVRFESPGALTSFVEIVSDPIVERMDEHLPTLAMFAIGIGVLLASFSIFDRVLPNLETPWPRFERFAAFFHQRYMMFILGLIVTGMTLSVSLSLTILVPLTIKNYVKRDGIIPYVMGANIATWIDTLFAALLLDKPEAFTIVFVEMITGTIISLVILVLFYKPYMRLLTSVAEFTTVSWRPFVVFAAFAVIVPVALLLI